MRSDTPEYLKAMASLVEPAPDSERAAERRSIMAQRIAVVSRETKRRVARERRRAAWIGGMSIAAAAVLLVWAGAFLELDSFSAGAPRAVSRAPAPVALNTPRLPQLEQGVVLGPEQASWGPGDHLGSGALRVGPDHDARVRLGGGALVRAAAGTQVQWRGDEAAGGAWENLVLEEGSLSLEVPSLRPEQRLTVQTAEALVEVRGTAFEVLRSREADAFVTTVRVREGLVQVSAAGANLFLAAGDEWTSRCRSGGCTPASGSVRREATRELDLSSPKRTKKTQAKELEASPEPLVLSELAEQNRLYQSALQAHQTGSDELARSRFETLLARYPSSPLAAGARRELERLDATTQRP